MDVFRHIYGANEEKSERLSDDQSDANKKQAWQPHFVLIEVDAAAPPEVHVTRHSRCVNSSVVTYVWRTAEETY
jgi:hypothetical protein